MLIAYWIVAGLLALLNLAAGGMKLVTPLAKLGERMEWVKHVPGWFAKLVSALEVLGALGLILPPLTGVAPVLAPIAAVGIAVIQAGAILTHIRIGEGRRILPNIVLLLLAVAAAVLGFLVWA